MLLLLLYLYWVSIFIRNFARKIYFYRNELSSCHESSTLLTYEERFSGFVSKSNKIQTNFYILLERILK